MKKYRFCVGLYLDSWIVDCLPSPFHFLETTAVFLVEYQARERKKENDSQDLLVKGYSIMQAVNSFL